MAAKSSRNPVDAKRKHKELLPRFKELRKSARGGIVFLCSECGRSTSAQVEDMLRGFNSSPRAGWAWPRCCELMMLADVPAERSRPSCVKGKA